MAVATTTESAAIPGSIRGARCDTVTNLMDFLHTLGRDETFWVGMATVQAALLIALVLDGAGAHRQPCNRAGGLCP
jgi:hypothetical protein